MISEKDFVLREAGFWHEVLPTAEAYIRECNAAVEVFEKPFRSFLGSFSNGLVNELAFRLFGAATQASTEVARLSKLEVDRGIEESIAHLSRLRHASREVDHSVSARVVVEARSIAIRLETFFNSGPRDVQVLVHPRFAGCGVIDSCEGDVLKGGVLSEIKAGRRPFRSVDLRQTLCYCALNFSSKQYDIQGICLVNPRRGVYFSESLETVCRRLSGRSAVELLSMIAHYASDPATRFEMV